VRSSPNHDTLRVEQGATTSRGHPLVTPQRTDEQKRIVGRPDIAASQASLEVATRLLTEPDRLAAPRVGSMSAGCNYLLRTPSAAEPLLDIWLPPADAICRKRMVLWKAPLTLHAP
jgi:hypothetical protein